jgi:CRP/FNR family transcriptional regulator
LKQYRIKRFKKGTIILQQDTPPVTTYVIKRGIVKTYNLTAHGEEKPINFSVKNELFPLGWVFGKLQRAQYYHEAFSDCELYLVPPEDYLAFIKSDPEAMFRLLDSTIGDLLNHQMRINALEQSSACQKVLHTLHYLSLSFGNDLRPDVVEIPLPLTQQDLANFMGLTRETTSTELKKLAAQKIIAYKRRKYVVRTDKLNEMLDDEYGHRLVR